MIEQIDNILLHDCQIHKTEVLLVGVSGGPDSLFLLHVLNKNGYKVVAAHINHKLRPEADEEARFVRRFAEQLGIAYTGREVDVQGYASERKIATEEAARILRYETLFEQADRLGAQAVLVGHTADDQVETILMHLLRGSGISGLRGMQYCTLPNPWSKHIMLARPLLSTWRADIMRYLEQNQINPAFDQTNLDTAYFRNRVRHELLPTLMEYAPHFRQNLLRLGQVSRDDYDLIQENVDAAWDTFNTAQEPEYLAFHRTGFTHLPPSIQRYLLRRAIEWFIPGMTDVDFECIERGRNFLAEDKPSGQVDLMAGVRLIREAKTFWVTSLNDLPVPEYPQISAAESIFLPVPGKVRVNNGWVLEAAQVSKIEQIGAWEKANADRYQAWFDMEKLKGPLVLRARKSGDRIQPEGLGGHSIKVSDLMINQKLPARARRKWPLVCCGDEVLWVPGYRLSSQASVDQGSTTIIHLKLVRDLGT
jgi:tRNA(Ile)-lysidine synthase